MILHWMFGEVVVDESTFLPGKDLILEASMLDTEPQSFQVFQIYSSAMRQILSHIGIPERRSGPPFAAVSGLPGRYRSDRPWRVPEPRGWRKSAAWAFVSDAADDLSGRVYTSRVGKAYLGVEGQVEVRDPIGVLPVGVDGSGSLKAQVIFGSDPELSVELLTGETLVEHMLANLVQDVSHPDDPESADLGARIELALPDLRASLEDLYTPPRDWTIEVSRATVAGDEGDIEEISLDLVTPSSGTGYLAVGFYDPAQDDGETSDAWAISVDADLSISAQTDPSSAPLPELTPA